MKSDKNEVNVMADKNVLTFSNIETEEKTTVSAMDNFLSSNSKILLAIVITVVLAVVLAILGISINDSATLKQISAIDKISYALTQKSAALSDDELDARRTEALSALEPYLSKKGIIGVRSNWLVADIYYQRGAFEDAKKAYLALALASPKSYTAPIGYYCAAECCENLGDNENALAYYEKAESYDDFMMKTHTIFNIGRVKETAKDYEGAKAAYSKLTENYPNDEWTKIAKSRLLDFEVKGLVQ